MPRSAAAFRHPLSLHRRRLIGAFGAGALGAWLGGCASAPTLPPRPLDGAAAPRIGDTWAYQYTSIFRALPPRTVEIRLTEVGPAGLRDRVTVVGAPEGEEHGFGSAVEMVERPLARLCALVPSSVYEFSPYLQAFGALPAVAAVATPAPSWGQPFTGQARLRGTERVTVPAGSFEAARMDYEISRTPGATLQPRIDPTFTLATVWYAPAVKRAVQWTDGPAPAPSTSSSKTRTGSRAIGPGEPPEPDHPAARRSAPPPVSSPCVAARARCRGKRERARARRSVAPSTASRR